MRKSGKILTLISGTLLAFFSLLMMILEGRLLFSLDWQVYANPSWGFLQALFRFFAASYAFLAGLLPYFYLFLKGRDPSVLAIYLKIAAVSIFLLGLWFLIEEIAPSFPPLYYFLPILLFMISYPLGVYLLLRKEKPKAA
jgi:hypothetical protein